MDGGAEDRGIEPLRLLPAVQRLASVPSTHTGSVLQSRACHGNNLSAVGVFRCDRCHNTGCAFPETGFLGNEKAPAFAGASLCAVRRERLDG